MSGTEGNSFKNLQSDTLVYTIVTGYYLISVKDLIEKREVYKHRIDKLETKVHNMTTGLIAEFFSPGRLDCLKGMHSQHTTRALKNSLVLPSFFFFVCFFAWFL